MMPDAAIPFLIFMLVLLALNRWAREEAEVAVDDEDAVAARLFVAARIDEHVEALAERYLQAGGSERGDELPAGFAHDIERFIATAFTSDGADRCGVAVAVRCMVILERERIYAAVLARVQEHLIGRRAA